MNLLLRVNLAAGLVFAVGALTAGTVCSSLLKGNAKREAFAAAGLMMDGAIAMRSYTADEIVPLLNSQLEHEFLPQSVPSYAATQNFLKLREGHPAYSYKEATLNPTNPRDRAADWEADIIQRFRNDPTAHELVGERDTPMGRSLYLARPIRADAECLMCHSVPAAAPKTVVARYGPNNGFGWQNREIVGAQLVTVPLATAEAGADGVLRLFISALIAIFVAMLVVLNVLLFFLFVRPVKQMATLADALSLGDLAQPEFPTDGSTEIASLGRAFNRLRKSLEKALRMLGD
jgi:protein-histidine pros-kinase